MSRNNNRGQQGSLFGEIDRKSRAQRPKATAKKTKVRDEKWQMPAANGSTVASVRLLWMKRLTPAQVSQVEAEIAALPRMLTNLGFGTVVLERSSVRRKRE